MPGYPCCCGTTLLTGCTAIEAAVLAYFATITGYEITGPLFVAGTCPIDCNIGMPSSFMLTFGGSSYSGCISDTSQMPNYQVPSAPIRLCDTFPFGFDVSEIWIEFECNSLLEELRLKLFYADVTLNPVSCIEGWRTSISIAGGITALALENFLSSGTFDRETIGLVQCNHSLTVDFAAYV